MENYTSFNELLEELEGDEYTDRGEYSEDYQEEEYKSLDEIFPRMTD